MEGKCKQIAEAVEAIVEESGIDFLEIFYSRKQKHWEVTTTSANRVVNEVHYMGKDLGEVMQTAVTEYERHSG